MPGRILIVGTRGSALALTQTRSVCAGLEAAHRIEVVRTSGDANQQTSLSQSGSVGLFTSELERALAGGAIDLAVHSLKDLPTELPSGLAVGAMLPRAPVADVLLVHPRAFAEDGALPLTPGARVGSSSPRRARLLAAHAPAARCVPIRGNVPSRVGKCRAGEVDALLLARAGLERLGLDVAPLHRFELNPARWPCAPGQGAIAVELRADDAEARAALAAVDHAPTRAAASAERRCLRAYGGGCAVPFGAWAREEGEGWRLTLALPVDGALRRTTFAAAALADAEAAATAWLADGCPARPDAEEGAPWLFRPWS